MRKPVRPACPHVRPRGLASSPAAIVRALSVAAEADGTRLDAVVREALRGATPEPLSNADVRRVVVGGGVRVDGRVARGAGRPVRAGQRVRVTLFPARLASQRRRQPSGDDAVRVLFVDEDVIAVDKPAGLPTVPTADTRRRSLVDAVGLLLAPHGGRPTLGVHQRLDADTSGVVVFSRTSAAASGLDRAFAARQVTKVYQALAGSPRSAVQNARLRSRLDVSGRGKRGRVSASVDGREAATDVEVLEDFGDAVLVEARPLTGRKHQVRAQLAEAGLPLLGDVRYGGPGKVRGRPVPRPMLHAARLEMSHPVTGAPLRVEAALPPDFAELLAWLRPDRGRGGEGAGAEGGQTPPARPFQAGGRPQRTPGAHRRTQAKPT